MTDEEMKRIHSRNLRNRKGIAASDKMLLHKLLCMRD